MDKKIPILILAFNRPDHVKKAMLKVKEYQPSKLYLACDGARSNILEDEKLVVETQNVMLTSVDWPCKVNTLFRDNNLGCDRAIYEAITWFFENEEYGIIIEDDVILSIDFFKLCEDLLPRYSLNERIMEISARNHSGRHDINNSYVYAQSMYNWGWATWKRAWNKIHSAIIGNETVSIIYLIWRLGFFRGVMMNYYFSSLRNEIAPDSTWDTHWYRCILMNDGLVIIPGVNLAINVGMSDGTHYSQGMIDPYKKIVMENLDWPLKYNDNCLPDKKQKKYDSKDFFHLRIVGAKNKIKRWMV